MKLNDNKKTTFQNVFLFRFFDNIIFTSNSILNIVL